MDFHLVVYAIDLPPIDLQISASVFQGTVATHLGAVGNITKTLLQIIAETDSERIQ